MANQPTVINKREDVINKINELFLLLSVDDKKIAESLHKWAIERDMKIGIGNIRTNAANTKTNYDITYSAKKPTPRSIFLFKICVIKDADNATFGIKPKLLNIEKYQSAIDACPDSVKNVIRGIKECKVCKTNCGQQVVFTIDGVQYNSCTYGGEIFTNLTTEEWDLLYNLIVEEYKAHTAV